MAPIVLITRLAALAEAVAELREAQQHAAQAAAARAAAERLYAAARPAPPAQPRPAQHASTAAQLAGQSFPHASYTTSDTRTARSGSGRTATSTTAATTQATRPYPLTMRARTAQRIRYAAPAPERYRTPGEGILRHLVNAGCRMPCRCGVSVTFTLPPARSAWRRQPAYGHLRFISRTVTFGQEVVREIRSVALAGAWQHSPAARIRVIAGVSQRPNLPMSECYLSCMYASSDPFLAIGSTSAPFRGGQHEREYRRCDLRHGHRRFVPCSLRVRGSRRRDMIAFPSARVWSCGLACAKAAWRVINSSTPASVRR